MILKWNYKVKEEKKETFFDKSFFLTKNQEYFSMIQENFIWLKNFFPESKKLFLTESQSIFFFGLKKNFFESKKLFLTES